MFDPDAPFGGVSSSVELIKNKEDENCYLSILLGPYENEDIALIVAKAFEQVIKLHGQLVGLDEDKGGFKIQ